MRYVLLAYGDERLLEAMSAGERDALMSACLANEEALRQNGHLLSAAGLQPSASAATVRLHEGELAVFVGPCVAAGEQLTAVLVISARDLNEAIQVAAGMPQARVGPIEVRPLLDPAGASGL
jgi:hypothetical protein